MSSRRFVPFLLLTATTIAVIACNLTSALGSGGQDFSDTSAAEDQSESQTDPANSTGGQSNLSATATTTPTTAPTSEPTPTLAATPYGGSGRIAFISDMDSEASNIYYVDLTSDGLQAPVKVSDNDGTVGIDTISWNPSGQAITLAAYGLDTVESAVFEIAIGQQEDDYDLFYSEAGEYYSMPVWSSDGDELVITVYSQEGSDIWSLELASGELREIIVEPGYQSVVDWGPAEAGLLYMESFDLSETNPNYRSNLFRLPPGAEEPILVAENLITSSFARYSPDGKLIVFESRDSGNSDIYLMNSDGSNIRQLTSSPLDEFAADWSPDGTKIVFTMQVTPNDSDIYIMNMDGSNPQAVVSEPGFDEYPIWSP